MLKTLFIELSEFFGMVVISIISFFRDVDLNFLLDSKSVVPLETEMSNSFVHNQRFNITLFSILHAIIENLKVEFVPVGFHDTQLLTCVYLESVILA
jgi:hypothetical protein